MITAREALGDGRAGASPMWKMFDRATVTFIAIVALMVALIVVMAL